jgi:hypothetical protein
MISALQTLLNQIFKDHPPKNVLCVGSGTAAAIKEYLIQHTDCQMVQINIATQDVQKAMEPLAIQTIFEFAIVSNCIEHLEKASAEHLLARLRDIHTKKLVIVVPIGEQWKNHTSHWEETDLLALGFILKADLTVDHKPVHVYAFDITSYKTTPDWLNSKYWANPELWNKYWW